MLKSYALFLLLVLALPGFARGEDYPHRTFFVTRSMTDENLIPYLEAAHPEIVQIGQYGAMFHEFASRESAKGSTMQLPFSGERKVLEFQGDLNGEIHDLGLKAVGHFRLVKAFGDWEQQSGFIDYYNNRWPEDLLGPKPHEDLLELVQRDATGKPLQTSRYEKAQLAFCLSSPHARQMFKQMLKAAIDHGVDGVITTYNYNLGCSCPYCRADFRKWLDERNLESVEFDSIPVKISGYPDPEEATELHWLGARWGAESFKRNWDNIFIDYGRSLKPDLLLAQWNHMSNVSVGNERMFLPIDLWGNGENYFWESGGAAFVGKNHNLAEHKAGDAWLSHLVIRELGGGKPFVMGKYERIRLAVSMAEGYATGAMGMGRYMRFEDPAGFEILVRTTNFLHDHRDLFEGAVPFAEVALILPRQSAWEGNIEPFDRFRETGRQLCEDQVLFEVVADENVTAERLRRFSKVVLPQGAKLSEAQSKALVEFQPSQAKATTIDAPWTVRATAWSQRKRILLHLVNYDRDEGETKEERSSSPSNERPIPVESIAVDLQIPDGRSVSALKLHTPESGQSLELNFHSNSGRVAFTIPRIVVYGVVEITTDSP